MVERKVDFHRRRGAAPALDFHSAIFPPVLQPQFSGVAPRETEDHPGDFLLKLGAQDTPVGEIQDSMRQNRELGRAFLGSITELLDGHGSHVGKNTLSETIPIRRPFRSWRGRSVLLCCQPRKSPQG
jgi:hypothetical protein